MPREALTLELGRFRGRLSFELGSLAAAEAVELAPALRRLEARGEIVSETTPPDAIVVLASLGIPLNLDLFAAWDGEALGSLLEYFLTSPILRTPIEPFFSLARGLSGGTDRRTLRQLVGEELGRDFYLDVDGRVTLSRRWAARGRFFGTTEDDLETLERSPLWRELADLRHVIFRDQTRCATCPWFLACDAIWVEHPADGAVACDRWIGVLERIEAQARGGH